MATPPKPVPARTEQAEAARRAREEREAAALRENLRRRKARSRARIEPPLPPAPLRNDPDGG